MDQGDIIVPFDAMPSEVLTLSRVEGTSDRYYVIIDGSYLDLFVGGFETLIETGFSEYQRVSLASKALVFVLDTRAVDCQSGDGVALEIGVSADEILGLISLATNGEESLDAAVLAYLQGAPGVEGMAAAIREAFEEGDVEVVEQTVEQVFLGFCEDLPFPLSAACP